MTTRDRRSIETTERGSEQAGLPDNRSTSAEIADFVARVKAMPAQGRRGRLIFAMDATMSRQPTWDMALALQAGMFEAVASAGGLEVQLVYFRGAGECKASKWTRHAETLARLMSGVACRGGYTQIGRVLKHVARETAREKVDACVYVGDAVEEPIDTLAGEAGPLALLGVPLFLFQEGTDAVARAAFEELARLTGGAHCRFGAGAAGELSELLKAVARFAQGGRVALEALADQSAASRHLLEQMRPAS
ncbi:MAG: VWA domain-containing protein [Hyphomicrobiaceae bacterium]